MRKSIELIVVERNRQIEVEGYSFRHDQDENGEGQLSIAAACYAVNKILPPKLYVIDPYSSDAFPWGKEYDKREKHDRLHSLVIAGALIAAEIDLSLIHI